jgi:hypothetical protein
MERNKCKIQVADMTFLKILRKKQEVRELGMKFLKKEVEFKLIELQEKYLQ